MAQAQEIIPTWNLNDLYPGMDSSELKRDLAKLEADAKQFAADYEGKLAQVLDSENASVLIDEAIRRYEDGVDLAKRLSTYAYLLKQADVENSAVGKFFGDLFGKLTDINNIDMFFVLELNQLDEQKLAAVLSQGPASRWKPWFDDLAKAKPFQLEAKLEKLFADKSQTGVDAWHRLFDEVSASSRYVINGEELDIEAALAKMSSPDEQVRKVAAEALAKEFKNKMPIYTLIMNIIAKDREISDRWRGFKDIADSRHLSNSVDGAEIAALVAAVKAAHPRISHRYYAWKAKQLGKDKLNHWDRGAPLSLDDDKKIGWDEAKRTVLSAYHRFSPTVASLAQDFFDKKWIDAEPRRGKAQGAFSHPAAVAVHPYVFMSYLDKPRDVGTLAHELGHGVHQRLAAKQGSLLSDTPLTLAETASVFGEMLTFRSLLDQTGNDTDARRNLLAGKVEDMINTVVRQIAFYDFERRVHTARRETGELTSDHLGQIWLDVQSESLGPAFDLGAGYETFWSYIPHFIHTPFYVYAYAFGDCLVNSLYGVYEDAKTPETKEAFVQNYLNLLKAGGSKPYAELLAPFGLNPKDPNFWNIGLKTIEKLIDELEAMDTAPEPRSVKVLSNPTAAPVLGKQ